MTSDPGARRLLLAFFALNVLSFVDRQLVSALAPVLRAELGLSNAQVGLLIGVTFIFVFAFGLPVVGILADRVHRPRLVATGLGIWSAATALSGTAGGFWSMATWRGLVGAGEATLTPTAVSMLGDRFPPHRLGFATSVFYAGIPVGYACSLAFAALVAPRLGWRACFFLLGSIGLVALPLVWRLREPRRAGGLTAGEAVRAEEQALAAALPRLRRVFAESPVLAVMILAAALLAFTSSASQLVVAWLVAERGYAFAAAGYLAAAVMLVGALGNLAIGHLTDRARRRGPGARLLAFAALGAVGLAAALALYTGTPGGPLFLACWVVAQGWMLGWYGPALAAVHEAAPEDARASVVGVGLLALNLLGVALGPWITGLVGDRASLTAGLVASLVPGVVGLALFLAVARHLHRSRGGAAIAW
jgi:MFS family permease